MDYKTSPLKGVKVLDFSRLAPGEYCTMTLANMGADVVKIETPDVGDYMRKMGPRMYEAMDCNKRSVAIDFRKPEGRALALQLAKKADVVVESFRPGAMKHYGLDYDTVKAVNEKIVYCSLSGYGQNGPYMKRAGHDTQYMAVAGLLGMIADESRSQPARCSVPIADYGGGHLAATAIVAALYGAQVSGEGAYLDVALMDICSIWSIALAGRDINTYEASPSHVAPVGYSFYETKDHGWLTFGGFEHKFWVNLCEGIGHPELSESDWDIIAKPKVQEIFASKTAEEWSGLLNNIDTCWAVVNYPADMARDPQVISRGFVDNSGENPKLNIVMPCFKLGVEPSAAPRLGENSRSVLASIGLDDGSIAKLIESGIVKALD